MGIGATVGAGLSLAAGGVIAPVTVAGGAAAGGTLGLATGLLVEGGGLLVSGVSAAWQGLGSVVENAFSADDRTADQIISDDKQGSIRRVFPGEMLGKTLPEIEGIAKDKKHSDRDAAKRAKKLLKDKRFDKKQ